MTATLRVIAAMITVAWAAADWTTAAALPGLDVAGRHLTRVAVATRSTFFGAIDLYSIAIFMQDHPATLDQAHRASAPRAVRLRRLFKGAAIQRMPEEWQASLAHALSLREQHALESALRHLRAGQDVW